MRSLVLAIALSALVATPVLACGPGGTTRGGSPHAPALAVAIDDLLPTAQLSEDNLKTVMDLRAQIAELARNGREEAARRLEEQAMAILGYKKAWLRCGPGTFLWMKLTAG